MPAKQASPVKADAPSLIGVRLGEQGYDIVIGKGLLARTAELIASKVGDGRSVIVTDDTVALAHLRAVEQSFARDPAKLIGSIAVPPGEPSKSFSEVEALCERLIALGVERGDYVIALGGGVVGDLAGFASAILRRGVRLVQLPTTLLAQVDSSVGGKTGINSRHGKNLIGAFHQPSLVIADLDTLDTLPGRQFRAGYAEVAKYGLLGDPAFFAWLEKNWQRLFEGDIEARLHAVETSCRAKAEIVAEDEREMGRRALLNLGHTFGHALEAYAGFSDRLLHGEAIAIGMALAFDFSCDLGHCSPSDRDRAIGHLSEVGLPTTIAALPDEPPGPEQLLALMAQDKKVRAGKLALILVGGIGRAFIERDVALDRLEAFLDKKCEEA